MPSEVKLNIGSFTVMLPPPWVNLDIIDLSDYAKEKGFNFQQVDVTKGLPFGDSSIDFINCSHLIEHLTVDEGVAFLKACWRILKPDGRIRLGTPDVNKLIDAYKNKEMEKFNEIQPEEYKASPSQADKFWRLLTSGHKTCYDAQSLQQRMELAGFKHINQAKYNSELDMFPEVSVYMEAKGKFAESRIEVTDERLKIMVISTTVFTLPPKGYSGLEALVYEWAVEFHKAGHQVAVVAPEGSALPEGIELIPVRLREDEGQAYLRYKERLGEFDVIFDNSWLWYTVIAQMEAGDKQLPVVHIYHSDPDFLPNPPPIKYPCLVGLSKEHARKIKGKWGFSEVKFNYNGIPLDFYHLNPSIQRNGRYLFMARYTPEKMPLETIRLAKKCNIPLDLYGNTSIIRDQNYLNQCMADCDAKDVVFHSEVPREETVNLYQTHKALIHLVNYTEAFGLVPVEAMACGMPVIVNRRGALPELVEDGASGFVVDTIEQAEDIIRSGKVDTIKPEDCRKRAEMFSIEKSAQGYLELFREVVSGRVW